MKLHRYNTFLKESLSEIRHSVPTYEECVEMCSRDEAPFYEIKTTLNGFPVSMFNYRLAQYKDFVTPVVDKPELNAYEMRGLTFVFNTDGTLYNRYVLLEKFFNLNQVPESMYSIVKNYKIKFINNKEDGSVASFIKLPNGTIVGKSKMGFDNEQANGINRIYKNNKEVKTFVDWCLNNDIVPIFEFVAPHNRIVLKYPKEELILLRLRNNKTGKHINIKDHLDKIGSIKVAPFDDDIKDLDSLVDLVATQVDKEGCVVTAEDENGKDFFFKLKTPWYCSLHGLLTDDLYREHILIGYILDDKIDDILGQIPEDQKEAHDRINKMISIIKKTLDDKSRDIQKSYDKYVKMGANKKDYALNHRVGNENFVFVMAMDKGDQLKKMSNDEILNVYSTFDKYEHVLKSCEPYELAKEWIRDQTKRLQIARDWLHKKDPTLFFQEPDEDMIDN